MAPLTTQQRQEAARDFIQRIFVQLNREANLDTGEVLALIAGADDGLEASASTINTAIPQPVRTKASAELKAFAVGIAAFKRAGLL